MKQNYFAFFVALLLPAVVLQAGTIKVSFVDNETAIRATSELLQAHGCRPEAILAFRLAIDRYNMSPPGFERKRFPPQVLGFYSFSSASNLVEALPHRLCDSAHPFELNCFDAVILLAKDLIHIKLRPDELAGPFLPAFTWTNNVTYRGVSATARDAFTVSYPSWYTEITKDIMGTLTNETRMCLVATLYCWHALPSSVPDESLSTTLLMVLQRDWERQGLMFPTNMEVVLCHEVEVGRQEKEALTSHAGLLFHDRDHYVYIEKAGGSGPFVRLDFDDMADLSTWLAKELNGGPGTVPNHLYFATFNNRKIETLNVRPK